MDEAIIESVRDGLTVKEIPLSGGLVNHRLAIAGHTFQVLNLSPSASVTVEVDEQSNSAFAVRSGMGWTNWPFRELIFNADPAAGETLQIMIGGHPGKASPSLFRFFPAESGNQVEVTNTLSNPVPVLAAPITISGTPTVNLSSNVNTLPAAIAGGDYVRYSKRSAGTSWVRVLDIDPGKVLRIISGSWVMQNHTAPGFIRWGESDPTVDYTFEADTTRDAAVPVLTGLVLTSTGAGGGFLEIMSNNASINAVLHVEGILSDA